MNLRVFGVYVNKLLNCLIYDSMWKNPLGEESCNIIIAFSNLSVTGLYGDIIVRDTIRGVHSPLFQKCGKCFPTYF